MYVYIAIFKFIHTIYKALKLNNPDLEFIQKELDSTLNEASKYAQKDNETKKEFVLRVKEKALKLFELEGTPITRLASFIWTKLDNIKFTIAKSWFEGCFTDDEKRNYSDKFSTEHFIENKEGILTNPITGQIRINDVTYSPDLPSEVKPKTLHIEDVDERPKNKYTDLLNLIGQTADKLGVTCDAIVQRFEDNSPLIIEGLQPFKDNQKLYADYYAKISNSKDVLDDRNKWGDYEKIMAKFLMDSGETIAHIAKLMDYSSKFGSIGILNNEELENKVHQLGLCPSCNADIYYPMNERLKQIEIHAQFEI